MPRPVSRQSQRSGLRDHAGEASGGATSASESQEEHAPEWANADEALRSSAQAGHSEADPEPRALSKNLAAQTLLAYAQSRPRTPPVGQQPPRLSDFPTDASSRRASEFEAPLLPGQLQSTLRLSETLEGAKAASQPTASASDRPEREAIGLPAGAVPSRTQLRTPLERSLKTGQLPVHPGTRCLRCGADHPDSVCRDLHEFLQKQKIPKYKRLPDCEASFKVRSISDLDSKTGTFLADFQLELNWVDAGLQRDTHYTEDYQSQTLQLFPAFETHIFSPEVVIENAVEPLGLCPLPGVDSKLQIQAETLHGLWLRRKFHFKGLLECSNTTYANFPLDTHAIPISIRLKEWRGATPKVISPVPEIKEVRGSRKDAQKQEAFPGHKIPKDSVHLGDLGFVAWGVWSRPASAGSFEGQPDEERYELIMVVRRGLKRHVFTFFILSMAVLSGSTSLFCPLSVDMLAGRLSINVTVLLSMVAFSVQRPNAIENVPYNTLHDLFVQVCTLMTATLALCNLATHLVCFEMTDGCAECVREDSWCETGSCGSKVIDCVFFYVLVGVLVSCDVGLLIWARHIHRTEIWGFRALCRDLRPDSRQGLCKGGLSWARCPPFCLPRRLRAFQCCCRKGKLQRPGSKLETSRVIARRRDSVQKACAGRRDPHEGVPCFFLRRRDKFLPLPGGLCELTMQQWKEAVEQSQQKDRASLLPIRRCISRFSRSTMGTSAFSRRLQQPAVLEGPETHYLDLGGGEVGYYRYRQLPDGVPSEQITCIAADKMEWPGLKEVLDHEDEESPRVQSLREQLVSYLVRETAGQWADSEDAPPEYDEEGFGPKHHLLVGITGELAVELAESGATQVGSISAKVESFLELLEDDFCTASAKQWEIYYFLLRKEDEAFYERIAIGWLMENTDLKLTDTFAKDPKLLGYMRQQMTSWALLSGRKSIGELEQDEFIEKFMPLSRQATFEHRAWEALEWFRVMDEDGSGTITTSEMLNCMLESEELLQAVIRHRLFVGTLAGGPRSMQLTVAEPDPEKEGEVLLHYAKVGTRSPVLLGVFPPNDYVGRESLIRWENLLMSIIDGERSQILEDDLNVAVRQEDGPGVISTDWPSDLRGIFVGISSIFYAARDAGITERLIQKKDCLESLSSAMEAELIRGSSEAIQEDRIPKKLHLHQQKVANLAMAHSFISRLLHDDAWLYFRRSWQMGKSSFIATWSLGVFLNGKRRDGNQAAGSFTRVRSHLSEAGAHAEPQQEKPSPQKNWARRLSAALRFSAVTRRSPTGSTMD